MSKVEELYDKNLIRLRTCCSVFNDSENKCSAKKWDVVHFEELYNRINDKKEANEIINSLKICDPAVGSGHFLVSTLNELIAIKSELGVLMDEKGKTLRDYEIEIINGELIGNDVSIATNRTNTKIPFTMDQYTVPPVAEFELMLNCLYRTTN